MNNLVFNTVANLLKTTLYAENPTNEIKLLQMDEADNLMVSVESGSVSITNASLTVTGTIAVSGGTVAVSSITDPVTIGNASLTVAGTVAVSSIVDPITIGNASLTVAGTVAVSSIVDPVTIGNASLTVTVEGSAFTSETVSSQVITGTGALFDNTDISEIKVASVFLYNEGATPVTLSLQISPIDSDTYYIDDPAYTDVVLPGNDNLYISVSSYAHYARIQYDMGGDSSTVSAYFLAQA